MPWISMHPYSQSQSYQMRPHVSPKTHGKLLVCWYQQHELGAVELQLTNQPAFRTWDV